MDSRHKLTGIITKEMLQSMYNTMTDAKIGDIFGVTQNAIRHWRVKFGISRPHNRNYKLVGLTKERLQELFCTMSDENIGKFLGVAENAIRTKREKFGILSPQLGSRIRKYTIDQDFFATIDTPEKAYILGFIAADGNVSEKGVLTINIHVQDCQILDIINGFLGSNKPIIVYSSKGSFNGKDHITPMAKLQVFSVRMVANLINLGIVPRKSNILTFPDIDTSLERHFIRGYLDGDGCISKHQFNIIGTVAITESIKDIILRDTGHMLRYNPCRGKMQIYGTHRDRNVLIWLYHNSTIHLQRKFEKFQTHWLDTSRFHGATLRYGDTTLLVDPSAHS